MKFGDEHFFGGSKVQHLYNAPESEGGWLRWMVDVQSAGL